MARPTLQQSIPLPADDPELFELDLDLGFVQMRSEVMIAADERGGDDRRGPTGPGARRARFHAHGARWDGGRRGRASRRRAQRALGQRPDPGPVRSRQQRGRRVRRRSPPGAAGGPGGRRLRRIGGSPDGSIDRAELESPRRRAERRADHAPTSREVAVLANGIEKAAVVVDALLGTGVSGALRGPNRSAVELARRARAVGVPVVAVDTPTAVDLTSGELSDPVVRADATVTFHRPKSGLETRRGRAFAGGVLVAPIGIPASR